MQRTILNGIGELNEYNENETFYIDCNKESKPITVNDMLLSMPINNLFILLLKSAWIKLKNYGTGSF